MKAEESETPTIELGRVGEENCRWFKAYTKMATECIKLELIDSCTSTESIGD